MRYLGLDLGTKSLGVSVSDFSNTFAMPYQTLHFPENEYESVIDALEKIVKEMAQDVLIIEQELRKIYIMTLNVLYI